MFSDCSSFVRIGLLICSLTAVGFVRSTGRFVRIGLLICSPTAVGLLGLDLLICSLITNMFSDCSSFVRIGFTNMFSDY